MNKIWSFLKLLGNFPIRLFRRFQARSISTQLIITIILIFASFFTLQIFLNAQFFKNFYTQEEFNDIHSDLMNYVERMNDRDNDYYDEMYAFTSERNAYSVVVNGGTFKIMESTHTDYTIVVEDTLSTELYEIIVPDNSYNYSETESISLSICSYNELYYTPSSINTSTGNIYTRSSVCAVDDIISVSGTVVTVNKPNNMNYAFDDNKIVQQEINKLANDLITLSDHSYDTVTSDAIQETYWYKSTEGAVDTLVFVHDFNTWDYIITIIPIEDTADISAIVSSYNYYVYLTAIVIIFLWSFRLSSIISKPIQNIELVAREIAELNFNVEAHEYNNKENASLSRSINLISKNLKETLETVNKKNEELTQLYDEQSKQVSLKKQLVSSISHELKTPLMIMQVTIQGILDGIIDKENQEDEMLNVIDEINKSSIMIQDMLQIYRLDDANTVLEISEFDLTEILHYFLQDFEQIINKYQFDIVLNVEKNVRIEADEKLIKRVISNFITNAIKYTPEGNQITFEIKQKEDKVYFEVINHGAHIEENDLENIWMPFFRGSSHEEYRLKTKGSGIGLYLVSEILKAHKADFGIENIENAVRAYFCISKKQDD